mmetsp:Transcript_9449/g.12850  ORF Transcript_9449/g.12850 Transcript_9449/m.12850 type:complete len:98 (-) Transcript_9449:692-985(-)
MLNGLANTISTQAAAAQGSISSVSTQLVTLDANLTTIENKLDPSVGTISLDFNDLSAAILALETSIAAKDTFDARVTTLERQFDDIANLVTRIEAIE